MSEHLHHSDITHKAIDQLTSYNKSSPIHKTLMELELHATSEDAYEIAWSSYSKAKREVIAHTIVKMNEIVLNNLPHAKYVLLYEDHSHDAPHGHVEVFLDETQHAIELSEDWHDLAWSSEVDEYVWDIYNLGKEYFTLVDGKRRLLIEI
jgi:hypothetical protein